MEQSTSFGHWLRKRRRLLDLTQSELAALVGCSSETIRKFEAERQRPSRGTAERLADKLAIEAHDRAAFLMLARAVARSDTAIATETAVATSASLSVMPVAAPQLIIDVNALPPIDAPLFGRNDDIQRIRALLQRPNVRLVTLIGPGGAGKTRLAYALATELAGSFDLVAFVSLVPVAEPGMLFVAVCESLHVRELLGSNSLELLVAHLHAKRVLLILDNFEHIIGAAPLLLELLAHLPQLDLLVTSRAALRLRAEREYTVAPLALFAVPAAPPADPTVLAAALADIPSVQLFVDRVQATRSDFLLTAHNALDIAKICARLDGLPLALELAAARTKLLSIPALLARLEKRLPMLSNGAHDLPDRQRSLRDTISWSYDLLDAAEQRLFGRLAVFVGGCTLEAAEAVCGTDDAPRLPMPLFAEIETLVNNSLLVHTNSDDQPRLNMLETIREYALERLEASGEAEQVRWHYATYYRNLAEQAEPQLSGAHQAEWLERLAREHDNIRSALGWALATDRPELAARIASSLGGFWRTHGHLTEGRRWLRAVLAGFDQHLTTDHRRVRVQTLLAAGWLAGEQADYRVAQTQFTEALAGARMLDDAALTALALHRLGNIALMQSAFDEAEDLYGQCLAISRSAHDVYRERAMLGNLGFLAENKGQYVQATACYDQVLSLARSANDTATLAWVLNRLGDVALLCEQPAQATVFHQECLAMARELNLTHFLIRALVGLGEAARQLGQFDQAVRDLHECLQLSRSFERRADSTAVLYYLALVALDQRQPVQAETFLREALELNVTLGLPANLAATLDAYAALALLEQRPAAAVRLLGAAATLAQTLQTPRPAPEQRDHERWRVQAIDQVDAKNFAVAWQQGMNTPLDKILADIRQPT